MHYIYDHSGLTVVVEDSQGNEKYRMLLAPENIVVNSDGTTTYKLSSGDKLTIKNPFETFRITRYLNQVSD